MAKGKCCIGFAGKMVVFWKNKAKEEVERELSILKRGAVTVFEVSYKEFKELQKKIP
jgi:hypothetical protein